jgi:hypothetical protein
MFEKMTKLRSTRIAFLPHTLKLEHHNYNVLNKQTNNAVVTKVAAQFTISAYWHEVKAGKPIVAFGFYFIEVGDKTVAKLAELGYPIETVTYQQLLAFARKEESEYGFRPDGISSTGVVKFGHSRPYHPKGMYECYYPEVNGVYHDEQELIAMQANPNYIPVGADGWYALNKKQAF